MSRTVRSFVWIAATVAVACGETTRMPSAERARERPPILIQSRARPDTLAYVLIARQRDLFDAMAKRDSARLVTYLEVRFGWQLNTVTNDARGTRQTRLAGAPRLYADFLAGFVPEQLSTIPTHYEIVAGGADEATVEALWLDRTDRLVTRWVDVGGMWKARRTDAFTRRRD